MTTIAITDWMILPQGTFFFVVAGFGCPFGSVTGTRIAPGAPEPDGTGFTRRSHSNRVIP